MKKQTAIKIVSRLAGLTLLLSLCSEMTSCEGMDLSGLNGWKSANQTQPNIDEQRELDQTQPYNDEYVSEECSA